MNPGYEDCTQKSPTGITTGFVPAATLGISGLTTSNGLLLDSWNNPLRYSLVTTANLANSGNPDFSDSASIKSFFSGNYTLGPTNMIEVNCTDPAVTTCNGGLTLTNTTPVIILTMGENWASSTSIAEATNAGDNTLTDGSTYTYRVHLSGQNIYVSNPYSEENFDDQIVWLSPYVLFNRMVSAGKLP
jgi:hypothetical protein